MSTPDTIEEKMYNEAERRKVGILKAINRKDVQKSEKIYIRNFVSELLSVTLSSGFKRNL